jgi:hypothetical protein
MFTSSLPLPHLSLSLSTHPIFDFSQKQEVGFVQDSLFHPNSTPFLS